MPPRTTQPERSEVDLASLSALELNLAVYAEMRAGEFDGRARRFRRRRLWQRRADAAGYGDADGHVREWLVLDAIVFDLDGVEVFQ